MSTTAGQAGVALVEAKDYAAALPKLNTALAGSSSPAWLLARSKCHIAQASYELALRDAEAAYLSAASRGSRPLMIDAQYRRAVALFRLGRLADADACALWSMKLAEGISMRDAANLVLADEDDTEKESVNDFFKTLYKGATDEQKRAMMKSFTESNGTSLSTNWDDVKTGKVETVPPEGVNVKKWEA
ncbi:hypothetical protein VdG2_04744 [Verticillium dahliae VDG2]|nr:hypothetical protein VdG2_04744 [Verticillium dahliae VDG2]